LKKGKKKKEKRKEIGNISEVSPTSKLRKQIFRQALGRIDRTDKTMYQCNRERKENSGKAQVPNETRRPLP